MEACYEYLGCDKEACVMFGVRGGVRCWNVEGTLCNHPAFDILKERAGEGWTKADVCSSSRCIYYEMAEKSFLT